MHFLSTRVRTRPAPWALHPSPSTPLRPTGQSFRLWTCPQQRGSWGAASPPKTSAQQGLVEKARALLGPRSAGGRSFPSEGAPELTALRAASPEQRTLTAGAPRGIGLCPLPLSLHRQVGGGSQGGGPLAPSPGWDGAGRERERGGGHAWPPRPQRGEREWTGAASCGGHSPRPHVREGRLPGGGVPWLVGGVQGSHSMMRDGRPGAGQSRAGLQWALAPRDITALTKPVTATSPFPLPSPVTPAASAAG